MQQGNRRKPEESSGPAVGVWMVTFGDCMTLLLCFFVLLLTFSSFDEVALDKLGGAFPNMSFKSIFPNKRTIKDAVVPPTESPVDHTEAGSEKPTTDPPENIENPKPMAKLLGKEAYSDRNVVSIPSARLFYGRGSSLTADGKDLLKSIASFISRMPCQIVIGETGNRSGEVSLERAWTLMRYFTVETALAGERFSMSAANCIPTERRDGKPAVQIVLLARSLYR